MRGEVIAMDGYILRNRQEQLTLSADAADKLLQSGQGDAALLYLALRRFGRGVTPEELEKVLPISRLRIDAAEKRPSGPGPAASTGPPGTARSGGRTPGLHRSGHRRTADGQRGLPPAGATDGAAAGQEAPHRRLADIGRSLR